MMVWVIENAVVALALAAVAGLICRYLRPRPAVAHLLWVVVLLKLVTPPFGLGVWPPESVRTWIDDFTQPSPQVALDAVAMKTVERRLADMSTMRRANMKPRAIRNAEGQLGATPRDEAEVAARGLDDPPAAAPIIAPDAATENLDTQRGPRATLTAAGPIRNDEILTSAAASTTPAPNETSSLTVASIATAATPILLTIWGVGVVVFGVTHVRRARVAARLVARAAPAPAALETRVAAIAAELGVRPPRVRVTSTLSAPLIWASLRPTLVWPASLLEAPEARQRAMLAHELAHLRRRDHVTAWLELLVTALWWFHPLVWVVRPRLRAAAELACDAWVVGLRPDRRREYAEALIDACVRHVTPPPQGALALTVVTDDAALFEERLSLIMRDGRGAGLTPAGLVAMVLVAGLVLPSWSLGGPVDETAAPGLVVADVPDHQLSHAVLLGQMRAAVREQDWSAVFTAAKRLADHSPDCGEAHHWLGYTAIGAGRLDLAAPAFETQARLGFRPAVATYNLACVAAREGRTDAAFAHLDDAVRLGMRDLRQLENDPDLVSLHDDERWGTVRKDMKYAGDLHQRANRAISEGRWDAVMGAAESLLLLQPDSPRINMYLGQAALGDGDAEAADRAFAAVESIDGFAAEAAWGRARAAALRHDGPAVARHLDRAVEHGYARVRRIRGAPEFQAVSDDAAFMTFLRRLDEYDQALNDGERAFKDERWTDAVAAYRTTLDIESAAEHWRRLGFAYRQLGDDRNAQGAWRHELIESRGDARALYNLACAAARLGDPYLALKRLDQAITVGFHNMMLMATDEDLASIRRESAFNDLLRRAGDHESLRLFETPTWGAAYDEAKARIADDPDSTGAHLQHGFAALRLHKLDEAEAAFQRMLEIGRRRDIALYNLACVSAARGDAEEAFARLEQALDAGFEQTDLLLVDPDLAPLHDDPRFSSLRERLAPAPTASPRNGDAIGARAP